MKSLSLVIPAYGAGDLLGRILTHVPGLSTAATRCGFELIETIVVDDGSQPPIEDTASDSVPPIRWLRNAENRGKGYSVRRGALAAKGGWVLMSDVDESAPLTEFAALAPFADRAIACGSRRCGGDVRPFLRRVLSRLFNALTGTGLKDSQCGFKLFNMSLMRPVFASRGAGAVALRRPQHAQGLARCTAHALGSDPDPAFIEFFAMALATDILTEDGTPIAMKATGTCLQTEDSHATKV